jgi:hypothetical protein
MALRLPQVVESVHFALPDFRVRNKIFLTLKRDASIVVVKSNSANIDALVARDPAAFWDEWRGKWLGIRLDRVSRSLLDDLVCDAWRLVAPKRLAANLTSGSRGA